jgi:hypothetical protein
VKYVSSTNRTIAQAYCLGLLPRTIAQYYCLSNTKYLHRNYCFKSYLRTIVRIFFSSTTTSFFFLERGAIHPYPKKWGVKVGNWTTKHRSSSFGSTLASHEIFESVQNFPSVVSAQCTRALSLYKGIVITVQERERERKSDGQLSVTAQTLLSLISVLQWVERKGEIERRLMTSRKQPCS